MTTLFSVYLAATFSPRKFLRLLAVTFGLAIAGSVVFALILPSYGVHSDIHQGLWRGIFVHKNRLAIMMVLALTVFSTVARETSATRRAAAWTGIVSSLTLLALSGSVGGAVVTGCLALSLPIMMLANAQPRLARLVLTGWLTLASLALLLAVRHAADLLALVGRDVTLTGRTLLWAVSLRDWLGQPWLGFGYRAFWVAGERASAEAWNLLGWEPTSAHNSLIDILVELGAIGLFLFVVALARYLPSVVRAVQSRDLGVWYPLSVVALLIISMGESVLLTQNSIAWVMLVTTLVHAHAVAPTPTRSGAGQVRIGL